MFAFRVADQDETYRFSKYYALISLMLPSGGPKVGIEGKVHIGPLAMVVN